MYPRLCMVTKITKDALLLIAGWLFSLASQAQDNPPAQKDPEAQIYETGIGIRMGSGLTVKQYVNASYAIEGILDHGYNTLLINGLLEKHWVISFIPRFRWFAGAGSHVGFFRYRGYYYWAYEFGNRVFYVPFNTNQTVAVAGADIIAGIEYKFRNAPFTASIDIKPFIDFYKELYEFFDGAVSIRCVF